MRKPGWLWKTLIPCLLPALAGAQSIPADFFEGLTFTADVPTQLATGDILLLEGELDDPAIPAINFIFTPKSEGTAGVIQHRVRVAAGRFAHRVVFDHSQADSYGMEVWLLPIGTEPLISTRFLSVEVEQGDGPIEIPAEFYQGLFEVAAFEPNAVHVDDQVLPPLYVRTGGLIEEVRATFFDAPSGEQVYQLRDDGSEGDRIAADGVYSLTGVPYEAPSLEMGDFGHVRALVEMVHQDGQIEWFVPECGLIDGPLSRPVRLAEGVQRTEHVVNFVDDGTLYEAGGFNIDMELVAQRFYQFFPDEFDFLVVRSDASLANSLHGLNITVHNEIEGIGLDRFDHSDFYGSAGFLKSIMFINFRLIGPFVHELAHNWANFLDLFNSQTYGAHWGLANVGGVLGGRDQEYEDLGDGFFGVPINAFTSYWGGRYGPLELYLMGLIPAADLEPHIVLQDFEFVEFDQEGERYIVRGRLDTVTVEEIIASQGPRVPDWEAAQKSFRLGTVVISPVPLEGAALTYFERQSAFIGSEAEHDFAFAAATGYRASLDTRLGPSLVEPTAVLSRAQESLPAVLQLAQNYPNPFNSDTVIPFALPMRGEVELAVFNAAGQQVAVLVDGVRDAGAYAASWDGLASGGQALASGVYLYRLRVGQQVQMRKLLLLR